jgi:arylsulfatase A-like enzyme
LPHALATLFRRASAGVFALAFASCAHDAPAPRTNVLVVVLDTLRPDHLGAYGWRRATSPRLDGLAQESFVFENAQSAAPLTVASLLSLSTSLYPAVHQVQGELNPGRMSENVTTLAEILRARGYATAAFTEGGYAKGAFGLDQGFDTFPPNEGDDRSNFSNLVFPSRLAGNLDRTIAWLKEPRAQPFFVFFHTYEIHSPYRTRQEFVRKIRPWFNEAVDHALVGRVIESWNRSRTLRPEDALAVLAHPYQCSLENLPVLEAPEEFERAAAAFGVAPGDAVKNDVVLALVHDLYDASILYTDSELARLWNALAELDKTKDTLIVVLSDHGEGLGEHGEMEHGNVLHEEVLRVVFTLRVPPSLNADGALAPRHVQELVRTIDLAPTLLELLGIDTRREMFQGSSLVPLLRGAAEPERTSFSHARRITAGQRPQESVLRGQWRFVREPDTGKRWLYDRQTDPKELVDVAAEHPDVVERLEHALAQQARQDKRLRELIATKPGNVELDEATLRELRGLGYTGEETPISAPK